MPLEIAPEKVAHVIIKAREFDAKVGPWDDDAEEAEADEGGDSILEGFASDPSYQEAAGFIDALNEDEQVNLVALTWIGRGTFEPEDLEEAIETARDEATGPTSTYLLGIPLLADYLEEALDKLGFAVGEIENDVF